MKMKMPALLFALSLSLLTNAIAQNRTLTVDSDASKVAFKLAGSAHETEGTFHVQSGSINFEMSAPTMSGSVVVSAASGNTGNDGRDKKMHNDVLDVAHFADVSFSPKSYQGTIAASGDSTIQVTGVFTLHGAPHDMTVPMQVHIEGSNCTAKTHFTVPYVKWGLKDPSIFILKVAKEVEVDLTLVGHIADAK